MNIEQYLKELTIEEKISLLEGSDMGFTNPIPRLKIPKILLADGPHGVRVVKGSDAENGEPYTMQGQMYETTALSCEAAMAATWNTKLIEETGKNIGEECQEYGAGVLLGPGVNGKRSPLAGRNFEYYSEDPYLSGKMAASFINGLQSQGVGACLKHYVLNDQETRRTSVDVNIEERPLHELYLKPFEIAIKEAKPWAIMASYNKAFGTYLCQNKELLQDILREELGFDGVIVSDWSAVKDKVMSHKNGLDLQMPGPSGQIDSMKKAVEEGLITEQEINQCVKHVLELVEKVTSNKKTVAVDWKKHHENAKQLIEEGIVLLKNEDEILPLRKGCKIAVVGELADKPYFTGGGSSSLTPRKTDAPLEYLKKMADVTYYGAENVEEAAELAKKADAVLIFAGYSSTEAVDLTSIAFPEKQRIFIHELAKVNKNTIVITQCGSAIEYRQIENDVKAILHAWIPGEGFGSAIADLLFGVSCPSGKLSETFPVSLANTPAYQHFPGYKDYVYYHEGLLTGYRYYDTQEIKPQYPFGFGLSYTQFVYSDLKLSIVENQNCSAKIKSKEHLRLTFNITNIGNYTGQEIAQVYLSDLKSHMFRPKKELKGFAKIKLEPKEKKQVEIILDEDAFSYYVPHLKRFAVETGEFEIQIGASSTDIRLKEKIWFDSKDDVRMPLTMADMFGDFLKDDRYQKKALAIMQDYKIDKENPFSELFYGVTLYQAVELLSYMGVDPKNGRKIMEELVKL